MKSRLAIALLTTLLTVMTFGASAGTSRGTVGKIWLVNDAPIVMFSLAGELEDSPRCNELNRFAINLRAPGGQAAYQGLLTAREHGWPVEATGLNVCSVHYKSEDLKQLVITD